MTDDDIIQAAMGAAYPYLSRVDQGYPSRAARMRAVVAAVRPLITAEADERHADGYCCCGCSMTLDQEKQIAAQALNNAADALDPRLAPDDAWDTDEWAVHWLRARAADLGDRAAQTGDTDTPPSDGCIDDRPHVAYETGRPDGAMVCLRCGVVGVPDADGREVGQPGKNGVHGTGLVGCAGNGCSPSPPGQHTDTPPARRCPIWPDDDGRQCARESGHPGVCDVGAGTPEATDA